MGQFPDTSKWWGYHDHIFKMFLYLLLYLGDALQGTVARIIINSNKCTITFRVIILF